LLGAELVGLYLGGSLASGGFAPERSDIDFLAVPRSELPPERLSGLSALHARLAQGYDGWGARLEGSYIPLAALRRYDPANATHPVAHNRGQVDVEEHGLDWIIQRHVFRQHGLVLAGPPPAQLIDPLPPADLRRASRATLLSWWQPMLHQVYRLPEREYQAYAALTMCRILYTLRHAEIVPKWTAARWAQAELGEPWAELIESALAWPADPQPDRFAETCELIRRVIERSADASAEDPAIENR
jgi:hypothetical protein